MKITPYLTSRLGPSGVVLLGVLLLLPLSAEETPRLSDPTQPDPALSNALQLLRERDEPATRRRDADTRLVLRGRMISGDEALAILYDGDSLLVVGEGDEVSFRGDAFKVASITAREVRLERPGSTSIRLR